MSTIFTNIQFAFCVLFISILNTTRKSCKNIQILIIMVFNISLNLMEISHCSKTGICNNHHLAFSTYFILCCIFKCFNNYCRLLAYIVWMEFSYFLIIFVALLSLKATSCLTLYKAAQSKNYFAQL